MAKDPTQGPVSTYDAEGNPTKTNVEETPIEEAVEETPADESGVDERGDGDDAVIEDMSELAVDDDAPPDEEEAPEEGEEEETPEEADEEDEFEIHEHEMGAPLTYADAEKQLKETAYLKLREMALADGLKPERSKAKIVVQLLNHWFAEPPSLAGSDEPQMSARVRRIKEASSQ